MTLLLTLLAVVAHAQAGDLIGIYSSGAVDEDSQDFQARQPPGGMKA